MKTFLVTSFLYFSMALAQVPGNKQIDSIRSILKQEVHDSVRVRLLKEWDDLVYISDPELDFDLNKQILELSSSNIEKDPTNLKIYGQYKASALNNIGTHYYVKGKYKLSSDYYEESAKAYRDIHDINGLGKVFNNLGLIHSQQARHSLAIKYYTNALKIWDYTNDPHRSASTNHNIGLINEKAGNYKRAMKNYQSALSVYVDLEDTIGIARVYSAFGALYLSTGDTTTARDYLDKSIELNNTEGNMHGTAVALINMGNSFGRSSLDSAEYYYQKALDYFSEAQDDVGISAIYVNLGETNLADGNIEKALEFGLAAFDIAKSNGLSYRKKESADLLKKAYRTLGKYKEAFEYFEIAKEVSDSLNNHENTNAVIESQFQYEYTKKALADSLEYTKEAEIEQVAHNKELEKRSIIIYVAIFGFIMVCGFLYFIVKKLKLTRSQKLEIENQKAEIEEAHQEITDSISYAKRIQSAILPPHKLIKEYLPNSFVYYLPKDIVAGDFYWMEHKYDRVLFAAADCTGHGVPGAMVSVVCNNGLNRSVREYGITDPAKILDKTREIVIQEFEKSEEEVKDGMDIALCSIKGNQLEYAGAHNPLWIIRKDSDEIEEIKANKQPIGKIDALEPYKTHKLRLNKGDTIYIFSDGFADQFGGENLPAGRQGGKKYKSANFKRLLLSIHFESMERQKEMINNAFEEWKGSLEQLDDVCVIGYRHS